MWKNFLDKGKCLLGYHEGPWEYRQPATCLQVQICQRCAATIERVEHRWNAWAYEADGACQLARACGRCAERESRLAHAWGEPVYKFTNACDQVAICSRCREEAERPDQHVFDGWAYRNGDECTQIAMCSRCESPGTATRVQHDWSGWGASEFYEAHVRVCRHCGEMLVNPSGAGDAGVSMQTIEAAADALVGARSADTVRAHLEREKAALLSPVVEKYFQFAFEQYAADDSEPLAAAQRLLGRCRKIGIDQAVQEQFGLPEPPPPPPSAASRVDATGPTRTAASARDTRLVGHWRHTEPRSSGGFSHVIDSHCVLDEAGQFAWWSKSAGTMGERTYPAEYGTWQGAEGVLVLTFQAGAVWTRAYAIDQGRMIWPRDGRFGFWTLVS